jgi:hypothetical protein
VYPWNFTFSSKFGVKVYWKAFDLATLKCIVLIPTQNIDSIQNKKTSMGHSKRKDNMDTTWILLLICLNRLLYFPMTCIVLWKENIKAVIHAMNKIRCLCHQSLGWIEWQSLTSFVSRMSLTGFTEKEVTERFRVAWIYADAKEN